ncbi:hypothetical protein Pmar_PMAR007570 [Perkinsus marinus ATCC 50983]|uniref:RAP domain-containing protein n=1 Tax=Perkinsus marinus (strain ATCC 50983 / TXsc) TaxID=423536 RepID=C5LKD2_PERM5|nr:hypothetical protein Pmar_PMAR007570 [Perkinsus marinus ATCC 50983]EER02814.1 hypothetical protein Pmar_PMAR007570 [Perkinsus marinus ATCC 50983]|eukprot:XP_002770998.1 hypothetical protein Pmar_PMAR007570 [Perkinsus marinus ATCC 50983]
MPPSTSAIPLRRLFSTSAAAHATLKPPRASTINPPDVRSTAALGVLQPLRSSESLHRAEALGALPGVALKSSEISEEDAVEAVVENLLVQVDRHGDSFTTSQCIAVLKELTKTVESAETATRNMLSDGRLQHLVNRTVSIATVESASLKWSDVIALMESFVKLRLRAPLRDVTPICFRFMKNVEPAEMREKLRQAGRTLQLLGQGMVYHPEVFDFTCHSAERAKLMDPHTIALVLYEAGRHGLRTKHYTDVIVPAAAELAPSMSLEDLRLSMRGLMRFVKDWRAFFDVVCIKTNRVQDELSNMTNESLIMLMRVCKELKASRKYNDIHKEIADEISQRLSRREFSSEEQGMVSMYMDKDTSTWMSMVCDIGRDPFMLDKISFWQTGQFLAAISRLGLFDEKLYSNVADVITKDMSLYKDPETLASTLWAMAKSGFVQGNFVEASLASANSLINATNNNMNAWSQILWSLIQQGCDPSSDTRMANIVEFVAQLPVPVHRGHFRRLHQAADVLEEESPMRKYLRHPLSSATALPPRDSRRNQITNQIAKVLTESDLLPTRAIDTRVMVSPSCSSILDIAISAEGSGSAATPVSGFIIAAGDTDHRQMRVVSASTEGSNSYYGGFGMKVQPHADHEFEHIRTGQNLMYQRILARRGLTVSIIGENEWKRAHESGEEEEFLRKKLEEVGMAC